MNVAEFAVKRRQFTLVVFAALVAVGVSAARAMCCRATRAFGSRSMVMKRLDTPPRTPSAVAAAVCTSVPSAGATARHPPSAAAAMIQARRMGITERGCSRMSGGIN